MGGTGNLPVPSGNLPDGMGTMPNLHINVGLPELLPFRSLLGAHPVLQARIDFQNAPSWFICLSVKLLRFLAGLLLLVMLGQPAHGAATDADLILGATTAHPGDTVMVGVRLRMKPDWHIYWRNPGGSGIATKIKWELPPGVTAGETKWPIPKLLPADELTTYIYEKEVVLLVPLTISQDAAKGPLELKAHISWLECKTACVPGSSDVQATITVADESTPSLDAFVLQSWQQKLPLPMGGLAASATWEPQTTTNTRPLLFEWKTDSNQNADFYPYGNDNYNVQFPGEIIPSGPGMVRLRKTVKKLEGDWPDKISGLLMQSSGNNTIAHEVNLTIATPEAAVLATSPVSPLSPISPILPPARSLAEILLYAFLGGLILNVMPCVLPVIALKILGFVNQGREHPGTVRKLGLVYAAGVLASFLALAALVIAVKAAGHQAGWGMQFGNPMFIVVMTVLITLVALNLFGLFEINLGGKVMGAAGQLSATEGTPGAFFNGVLATVLATPCSAPFLGVALGFAFSQSYATIIAVFLTVGLGWPRLM
jgi:DsbC/DsbD-like thiol-disulfide interchange protein/cytochrome c biogenesis protein CcdA